MKTYFNEPQLFTLLAGMFLLAVSIFFFVRQKHRSALLFLCLGGLSMFIFAALLDNFVNIWDERFHALVAKNMMDAPFEPKLYPEKLLNIDYDHWAKSYIWMHKQPLFLWQIAFSFKLFGMSELSFRLPSIVMCTLLIPVLYRCGSLLVNKNVGYFAAFLFASSFYTYELISGRIMLDQNDIAFAGYITLSIWSWLEYRYSGKGYWLVLIGLFSGSALLCKWFVGLVVYLGWGISLLIERQKIRAHLKLFSAFGIALLVFLPWQIYTFTAFPEEAQREWEYNTLHFSMPIEGHGGNGWYHLEQMGFIFGYLVPFVLLVGFYFLVKKARNRTTIYGLLAMVLGVELFFSFAATKMPSFTYILLLPIFLAVAATMNAAFVWIREKSRPRVAAVFIFGLLGITCFLRIDMEELQRIHTKWDPENSYTRMLEYNRSLFLNLGKKLPENAVLLNVKGRHYVEAMYYTDALAYNFVPSKEEIHLLKTHKKRLYVFQSEIMLPDYILKDSTITILKQRLQGFE